MLQKKPNYSIYTYYDVWTLDDAYKIIVSECVYRADLLADNEFVKSVSEGKNYEIVHFLQDNYWRYTDNAIYTNTYHLIGHKLRANKNFSILRHIDLNKTEIDVKKFIKFAVWEKLPFPQELVDAFLRNSTGKQERIGAESHYVDREQLDNDVMPEDIKNMSVPTLRKKVKELSDEKIKWDKSIAAATRLGLLFYEKDLERPAKEEDFKAEFKRYLDDLPGTTITKIYKSLPVSPIQYKKTGNAPTKQPAGIDDESLDMIIEAAVASGIIANEAEFKDAKELEQLFTRFEFDIPPSKYLKIISGAARRVLRQYKQAQSG